MGYPSAKGAADFAGKESGFAGKYNSSHAEKKILTEKPNEPIGVTRPMCSDCEQFCKQQAKATNQPVVVTDPEGTKIFYPDGRVSK